MRHDARVSVALLLSMCAAAPDAASASEGAALPELPSEYLVHEDDGFRVAYHPGARERVRAVLPQLSAIREELRSALGAPVLESVDVRVVALPLEMQRVAAQPDRVERGGVASPALSLVVVSADGGAGSSSLERALRHHLAHLALSEATAEGAVPPWFVEGFAVHFARDDRAARAQEMEIATLRGTAPTLTDFLASAEGPGVSDREATVAADFVRYASQDPAVLPSLVSGIKGGMPFERALETAFGSRATTIDRAWREDAARRYAFFPVVLLGLIVWLAISVVARLRRRWARAASQPRADCAGGRTRRIRARWAPRQRVSDPDSDAVRDGTVPSRRDEIEVPKVEHDGRWHTLH
jgi:hypothetical protein